MNPRRAFTLGLIGAVLLTAPASAKDALPSASLFFTPQESREAAALAAKSSPTGQGDITLSAIMYYAPNDWTVWIQGERWTPQTSREDLHILDVRSDQVRLLWRGDGAKGAASEKEITLRANQTYQISSGKIIASP